jgi:hypothetical protein
MTTQGKNHMLAQKLLGDRLTATVRAEGARFVLIVSPNIGDGKTTYFEMVRGYLHQRYPGRFVFLASREILAMDPWSIPHHLVVVIDGPALNQGNDSLQIPENWLEMIDSAVVVVMGRETQNDELQECITRLQAMEIRCLGLIYNERHEPSWTSRKEKAANATPENRALPAPGAAKKLPAPANGPVLLPTPVTKRPLSAREAMPLSATALPREGKKKTAIQDVRPPLKSFSINEVPTIIAPPHFATHNDTIPNQPQAGAQKPAKKESGKSLSYLARLGRKAG